MLTSLQNISCRHIYRVFSPLPLILLLILLPLLLLLITTIIMKGVDDTCWSCSHVNNKAKGLSNGKIKLGAVTPTANKRRLA